MSGLRPPPKPEAPTRVALRMLVLVVLVLAAGVIVWTAVTEQRIDLIEDVALDEALEELELEPFVTSDGTELNLVREGAGPVPLLLLHDIDVAGGVIWDGVVAGLDPGFTVLRVDLPGFGLSERMPTVGRRHTVASMAEQVAEAAEQVFDQPVVIAGIGLGGEVGAEIAVVRPDLVSGLVLVDVDFYKPDGWDEFVQKLPWVGKAASFALETAGPLAAGRWAPNCEQGGWCPTASQVESRDLAETIVDTAASIQAFHSTPAASKVPSELADITAPVHYVWSQQGEVPRESVDRVQDALPEAGFEVLADAWKAHLDQPSQVAAAIGALAPQP